MTKNLVVVPISIAEVITVTMHPMKVIIVAIAIIAIAKMKMLVGVFIAARRGFHTCFLLLVASLTIAEALITISTTKIQPTITSPMVADLLTIAEVVLKVATAVAVLVKVGVILVAVVAVVVVVVAVFKLRQSRGFALPLLLNSFGNSNSDHNAGATK